MIGLQNSREIFIAGRLISEESLKFFASLNMTVLEMYGMTESTGRPNKSLPYYKSQYDAIHV